MLPGPLQFTGGPLGLQAHLDGGRVGDDLNIQLLLDLALALLVLHLP